MKTANSLPSTYDCQKGIEPISGNSQEQCPQAGLRSLDHCMFIIWELFMCGCIAKSCSVTLLGALRQS